jgi:hypothetical protein
MSSAPNGNTVQVVFTADGKGFSVTVDELQKSLDKFKSKATSTGKAVGKALGGEDVREKIHLLAETIGVRLPRSLQSVIAKSEAAKMAVGALGGAIVGIGALEFGGKAILDAIDGVKKFYDRLRDLPKAIDDGFKPLINSSEEAGFKLQVQNDKIQESIDKIEKHPNNGIALALHESYVEAGNLSNELDGILEKINGIVSKNSVGTWDALASQFTNKVQTQNEADLIGGKSASITNDTQKGINDGVNGADQKTINQDRTNTETDLYSLIAQQKRELELLKNHQYTDAKTGKIGYYDPNADLSPQIAVAQGTIATAGSQLQNLKYQDQGSVKSSRLQQDEQARQQAENQKAAAQKAATAKMQQFQADMDQMKQETSVSAKAEYEFWGARISAFTKGSEQYLAVQRQMSSLAVESAKAAHEALAKGMKEISANANLDPKEATAGIDAFNKLMREQAEDVSMTGVRWREYNAELAKAAELQVKQAGAMQSLQVQHAVQTGTMSKEGAARQMAGIHQADSEAEIRILQDKLAELQSDLKNLDPNSKDYETQKPQMQAQVQAAMAAISTAQGSAAQQSMQDQMNISDNSVWGQLSTALNAFAEQVTNVGAVLGQLATHSLQSVNNAILNPGKAGSHPWSNAALSIGKSAEGSALNYGEGKVLGMLGLGGGGKMGSKGNPMYVQFAAAASGVTSAISSATTSSGFLSSIGKFAHLFGFASGGNADAGTLAMVGEHGPELAYFGSDAHVTPNSSLKNIGGGGGNIYNIDASHSTNPAQTAAYVQHAIKQSQQQAVAQSVAANRELAKRKP